AERVAALVGCAGLQGRKNVVARKLLAYVEHVGANGAGGERASTHLVELPALAEIERDRDDIGLVLLGEPGNGDRGVEAARVGEKDSLFHARSPANSSRRFTSARARRTSGAMTRIVSSPAMVPTTSGSRARSSVTPRSGAWPGPVRNSTICCTRSTRARYSATARCSIVVADAWGGPACAGA